MENIRLPNQTRPFEKNVLVRGYLRYKTRTSQNVSYEAQVKDFLFHRKVMFHSQDIQVFVF